MSRKVTFSEVDSVKTIEPIHDEYEGDEPLAKKRLLDPDLAVDDEEEEDEEETADADVAVDPDELISGCQEAGVVHDEEGIKFTPFNLQEELEDGHFDAHGNYVFNKTTNIRDNWLDNVDWAEIRTKSTVNTNIEEPSDVTSGSVKSVDSLYEELLPMLHDGETVLQAIRRLGGTKSQSKTKRPLRPWEKKKLESQGKLSSDNELCSSNDSDMTAMLKLTEIADALLQAGEFDVYQETKEKIAFRCKNKGVNGKGHGETSSTPADAEDDELDQLGADFDDQGSNAVKEKETHQPQNDEGMSTALKWEVKMDALDDTPIEGPYTSEQMLQWVNDGKYSQTKALVRKAGTNGFSSIHRIDFELYLD